MIVPGNLISASTAAMQLALEGALDRDWNVAAGDLDWSCWATAAHITDALFSYASQVVAQPSDGYLPIEARVKATATPSRFWGASRCAVNSYVWRWTLCRTKRADGIPTAHLIPKVSRQLGVTEVLVHTFEISRGLGIDWVPPPGLSELAILRLFPDAPPGEPSAVLLWCTGRAALDDRPRQSSWSWHSSVRE